MKNTLIQIYHVEIIYIRIGEFKDEFFRLAFVHSHLYDYHTSPIAKRRKKTLL